MGKACKTSGKEKVYLSVVVPAYNEEARIPETLKAIGDYLRHQPYSYEIVAVNDGSKDNTAHVIEALIIKIANLKLINNRNNCGKGCAVKQGILAAAGEIRLFMDADNSAAIEEIKKLLPHFEAGNDVVIGSRHAPGAEIVTSQPIFRRFLGRGYRLLANILAGTWGIGDTQCGFKAMSAEAARTILPNCRINRFAFDAEILAAAKISGLKIKEVGIVWKNDLRSTVKINSVFGMFFDLLRLRVNIIKGIYNHDGFVAR